MLGAGQVAHAYLGDVGAAASGADDDERKLSASAPGDKFDLAAKTVAGIEHQVVASVEQFGQVSRRQELGDDLDLHARIDGQAAFGQYRALAAAELPIQCMQLAVGVGKANLIRVDQGQLANAASGQRLDSPRSHAPQADHADVFAGQALGAATAVEPVDAGKALAQNAVHVRLYGFAPRAKSGGQRFSVGSVI